MGLALVVAERYRSTQWVGAMPPSSAGGLVPSVRPSKVGRDRFSRYAAHTCAHQPPLHNRLFVASRMCRRLTRLPPSLPPPFTAADRPQPPAVRCHLPYAAARRSRLPAVTVARRLQPPVVCSRRRVQPPSQPSAFTAAAVATAFAAATVTTAAALAAIAALAHATAALAHASAALAHATVALALALSAAAHALAA